MRELVGQTFAVAGGRYRVVDVRRMSGETMVYAEDAGRANAGLTQAGPAALGKLQRTAFHYGDIAGLLITPDNLSE